MGYWGWEMGKGWRSKAEGKTEGSYGRQKINSTADGRGFA